MKIKRLNINCAIIFTLLIIGCKSQPPAPTSEESKKNSFTINSVTWMIERLDSSIWNGTFKGEGQMFVSFFINYSGTFDIDEIKKLVIESPVDMWILNTGQLEKITDIDEKTHVASIKRLQSGEGKGSVTLGLWKFSLTQMDGSHYEQNLSINGFEYSNDDKTDSDNVQIANEGKDEEIKVIVPKVSSKNEIAALEFPIIKSVSKEDDSIEIFFTINDKRVKNGYFWFDVPGEKYYKDSGSMIDGEGNPVNGCRVFFKDGKDCRYILRKDNSNSQWFDKIVSCFFVVSDTNRVSSPWEERNRTVSAKVEIK